LYSLFGSVHFALDLSFTIGAVAIGAVTIGAMGCFLSALEQRDFVGVVAAVDGAVRVGGAMIPSELELGAVARSGF
jgi:hypothetical protein